MKKGEEIVCDILKYIGEDPAREGLIDTPKRVVNAWGEIFAGYNENIDKLLSTAFADGSCHEMVILKDIEIYSVCEHHLLPFIGKAHVGYLPNGKVLGVSKIVRLVRAYSQRLQIQERLAAQIADALMTGVNALGAMVIIQAQHLCMRMRGVRESNSVMETIAIRGKFESAEVRQEFLSRIKQ